MSTGTPPLSPRGNNSLQATSSQTYAQKAQKRLTEAKDTLVSYTPKIVRESSIWSYITWPFSAFASFLGAIRARIANRFWPTDFVSIPQIKIVSKGMFWNTTFDVTVEEALTYYKKSIEEVMEQTKLSLDQHKIQGLVPVTFKGYIYNEILTLKDAITSGRMTVDEAIKAGHFEESHADSALWLQKKESV